MLFYLIYISKTTELINEKQLFNILQESKKRNLIHGITGMLIYVEGQFLTQINGKLTRQLNGRSIQIIEGYESEVRAAFKAIASDNRHYDLIILKEGYVSNRNFESWEMGFSSNNQQHSNTIIGFIDLEKIFSLKSQSEIINKQLHFLASFYQMSKSKA